jgi:transposase
LKPLNGHIDRTRKEITGDVRKNPVRRLLLRNRKCLGYFERSTLGRWLAQHQALKEIYLWKEELHLLYPYIGIRWANRKLQKILDMMTLSDLPDVQRLRRTLMRWRKEILNYSIYGLTNARTEGFNSVAKTKKKKLRLP